MANRVLLGNLGSGNFGLKVSKKNVDVTTAADKDLLFNSNLDRTGQIYAGANNINFNGVSGNPTENAGINFLTAVSPNKTTLGYIPLILRTEKNMGERTDTTNFTYDTDQISAWETTTTSFIPVTPQALDFQEISPINNFTQPAPQTGRSTVTEIPSSQEDALNVNYFVLRIPCAYGYMTATNFGS